MPAILVPSFVMSTAAAMLVQSSTRIRMRSGRRSPKQAKGVQEGEWTRERR